VIDPDSYLLFIGASILLVIVPGPDMAYMLGRTIAQGRKAGVLAAIGFNLGGYVHLAGMATTRLRENGKLALWLNRAMGATFAQHRSLRRAVAFTRQ
jgi:threonine/homoserine/homoserine lactone efflux protein